MVTSDDAAGAALACDRMRMAALGYVRTGDHERSIVIPGFYARDPSINRLGRLRMAGSR
jgi:hypothetical protein